MDITVTGNPDVYRLNKKLNRIKLRLKGTRIFLRGTLPAKPGDGITDKQYDLSTGLSLDNRNLQIAFARAQEIDSRLTLNQFNWSDYLGRGEIGTKPIRLWIAEFAIDFWHKHDRTAEKEYYYKKNYGAAFDKLPPDAPLSEKVVLDVLLQRPASSAQRALEFVFYRKLLKFANIENQLSQYRGKYQTAIERELPSDAQVVDWIDTVDEDMIWTFGVLAAYGLRPHELQLLDCSRANKTPYIVKVHESTKTGGRLVYPVPGSWVERWELWNKRDPVSRPCQRKQYYSSQINQLLKKQLKKHDLPMISAYHFRDAYAVRCALAGIDAVVAAKWMGHSLQSHWSSYLKFFDERHHTEAWNNIQTKLPSAQE
jgi:hypothetical protein